MQEIKKLLFAAPVFEAVPASMQEDFLSTLNFKTKIYNREEPVFNQGEPIFCLPVLIKGIVKAEMFSASGTILQIDVIKAPFILAPVCVFATDNHIPVSVTALEQSELVNISTVSLKNVIFKYPVFGNAFFTNISDKIHFLTERLNFQSIKTIKGKLAQYILNNSNCKSFVLPMNQTNLANYFGVERPSVSRALSEIVRDKIIVIHKHKGEILNLDKLKSLF